MQFNFHSLAMPVKSSHSPMDGLDVQLAEQIYKRWVGMSVNEQVCIC